MLTLKPLSRDGIPGAMKKAERYRLLNQPWAAESICRDVLEVDPSHQEALVVLLLVITDQFGRRRGGDTEAARILLPNLTSEYKRAYYAGIICEREAKALLDSSGPADGSQIYEGLRRAMDWYEKAETLRSPGEDDALLRWNTCLRILRKHPELMPGTPEERSELPLE
jgi:hypothetical protein